MRFWRLVVCAVAAVQVGVDVDAATLPVGSRAEPFSLKVVNADAVQQKRLSLGHYVGERAEDPKKLVVISFFATYCEPCKRELPYLQALYAKYAEKGLGILVVSIDKDGDVPGGAAKVVGALAAEHGLTYPILHDRFNILAKRYGVEKLPCLYVIGEDGTVALTSVGYTPEFTEQLTTEVQTRLGVPLEQIGHPAKVEEKRGKKKRGKGKRRRGKRSGA